MFWSLIWLRTTQKYAKVFSPPNLRQFFLFVHYQAVEKIDATTKILIWVAQIQLHQLRFSSYGFMLGWAFGKRPAKKYNKKPH
jgi:hypothetical protein